MPEAYFLEDSDETITSARRPKKWETPIATEGYEVQITAAVWPGR
jgi:hypothetical protein